MDKTKVKGISPRVETKEINGIICRKCADCGEWFPFDFMNGKSYCKECISTRNREQKQKQKQKINERKDPTQKPRNRVKTFLIDNVEYRLCRRCEQPIVYNARDSYCKRCASIITSENTRKKKAGIHRDNSPKQSDFDNNRIPGLFDMYENEEAKKAMLKGDFKAFMEATEKR